MGRYAEPGTIARHLDQRLWGYMKDGVPVLDDEGQEMYKRPPNAAELAQARQRLKDMGFKHRTMHSEDLDEAMTEAANKWNFAAHAEEQQRSEDASRGEAEVPEVSDA